MTSSPPDTVVGRHIDYRYRVLEHLADGGMAHVYIALDERLERRVALKVMRPDLARDATLVERFRWEARSAARLSHPHVVGVFDQGQDGDLVFLTMEYVKGRTLREVLDTEGAMSPRKALQMMRQILDALFAAHEAGILHRDVKPENVLITPDGNVKVADFGLARAVSSMTTTTGNTMLGTASYLAPEQVEGLGADARSDVYAAGLVFYEMLTGKRAVDGDSPITVAYQHVHGEIPPPSRTREGLSVLLDQLVASATHRNPAARPADAGVYLSELIETEALLSPDELDIPAAGGAAPAGAARTHRLARPTEPVPRPAQLSRSEAREQSRAEAREQSRAEAREQSRAASPDSETKGRRSGQPPQLQALLSRFQSVPTPVIIGLVVALVLVGGGIGWFINAGPGAQRTVPAIVGITQEEATTQLSRNDLRAEIQQVFSEDVFPGKVISSDPQQGSVVRRGRSITVTVSKGKERSGVPDVVGKPVEQAKKVLTDARFTVGTITESYDENVAAGSVISTNPPSGSSLKPGSPIEIVTSKGRKPIELRDFTGKPFTEAKAELEKNGLVAQVVGEEHHNDIPKGSVVKQSPSAGPQVRGTQVKFTLSKGPENVTIPDLYGVSDEEAKAALHRLGLQVEVERRGFFRRVYKTDPEAGQQVPRGTKVTIVLW